MMTDRQVILSKLYKYVSEGKCVDDCNKMIDKLLVTKDVPDEVKEFVNSIEYYQHPLIEKLRDKRIYKSLKAISEGADLSDLEVAKAITSLITHSLIEAEQSAINESELDNKFNLVGLTEILKEYFTVGKFDRDILNATLTNYGYIIKKDER